MVFLRWRWGDWYHCWSLIVDFVRGQRWYSYEHFLIYEDLELLIFLTQFFSICLYEICVFYMFILKMEIIMSLSFVSGQKINWQKVRDLQCYFRWDTYLNFWLAINLWFFSYLKFCCFASEISRYEIGHYSL